ncbi:hypothetical protein FOMG_19650 [Fusarium oxysporum f. sp. melonis 26406]|uniref:Uncharacterized protein n=1 Tax=Fusarium oxysporum f. sp. melonis 26406 TaxID=1089452 RepID=W9YWR0_FUSOX|nr:hypothetical protein FOMG_19650 [Fusarium oxysporum f. sp. melonis 26406]
MHMEGCGCSGSSSLMSFAALQVSGMFVILSLIVSWYILWNGRHCRALMIITSHVRFAIRGLLIKTLTGELSSLSWVPIRMA